MGVGIDANWDIFITKDAQVFPVGIEITYRPVSTVGVDLICNLMFFEASGQLPVKMFRIAFGPESVNGNQVAMRNDIEQP